MLTSLTELYGSGKVWGGMFYPATLVAARKDNGRWKSFRNITTARQKANRDLHVFKVAWKAVVEKLGRDFDDDQWQVPVQGA